MRVEPNGDGAFHRQPDVITKGRACDSFAGELREACIYLWRHLDRLLICGRLSFIRRLIALVSVVVGICTLILVVALLFIILLFIMSVSVLLILRHGGVVCGGFLVDGFCCVGFLAGGWLADSWLALG